MDENCRKIKNDLETFFDIPFDVRFRKEYQDPEYIIFPQNDLEELFEVKVLSRQKIRLIIEIEPQKYAASMMESINQADEEKRKLFSMYISQIRNKGAKVEFLINQQSRDMTSDEVWKEKWKKFRIRATQIIPESMNDEQEIDYVMDWAKISVGMMLSLLEIESNPEIRHLEGGVSLITLNRYERNPVNRELCLNANGYVCKICGFDFEKFYGIIGHRFIHVHHIEMVSSFEESYYLDPEKDMIPVCPNCHAMLHRENPPMLPEKLCELIKKQKCD